MAENDVYEALMCKKSDIVRLWAILVTCLGYAMVIRQAFRSNVKRIVIEIGKHFVNILSVL